MHESEIAEEGWREFSLHWSERKAQAQHHLRGSGSHRSDAETATEGAMKIGKIVEDAGERDVADLPIGKMDTAQQSAGFLQTQLKNSFRKASPCLMEDVLHVTH